MRSTMAVRLSVTVAVLLAYQAPAHAAPSLLEYPAHPATYGDHTINAVWTNGPTPTVLVDFQSDEAILHGDGIGQSQRTARNTLTYTAPSSPGNPQDFDHLGLIAGYGGRLPLLQQMSANGTSVLTYRFPAAVSAGFDLFVTDVDDGDAVRVRAFGLAGAAIDMTSWRLAGAGDLSLYKNTGTAFSTIVAPLPTTSFSPAAIQLTAVDSTNYNRSFAILRAPLGNSVERVEVEFTGMNNSSSRAAGDTGSHVYVALSTLLAVADFDRDFDVDPTDLVLWKAAFNLNPQGDADGDLDSDGADLLLWQRQLGSHPALAVGAAVPEPNSARVVVGAVVFLLGRRRGSSLATV